MADDSEPPTPGDFSFAPTPASMSPDQFWGMLQNFTPEQRAMAGQFFGGDRTPTPAGTPTIENTPTTTNTPERFVPAGTPESSSSRRSRRWRASGGGGGGGCCGGGGTDGVSPDRTHPPISSVGSTPRSSPRTPWATRTPSHERTYTVRSGAMVQDAVGKEMRARIWQLCTIQFGHEILKTWDKLDRETRRNFIIEQIKQEFIPSGNVVSNEWIKYQMVNVMSHIGDQRREMHIKKARESRLGLMQRSGGRFTQEATDSPDKFWQQRDAARAKNESVGSSHLGSGGYETLREDFVSLFTVIVKYIIYAYTCTNINFTFWTDGCGRT